MSNFAQTKENFKQLPQNETKQTDNQTVVRTNHVTFIACLWQTN